MVTHVCLLVSCLSSARLLVVCSVCLSARRLFCRICFLEDMGDPVEYVSDAQLKELSFNEKKVKTAKAEAYLSGALDDDAGDGAMELLAANHTTKLTKNQKTRTAAFNLKKRRVVKASHDMAGAIVFFEPGLEPLGDTQLRRLGVTRGTRTRSNLFATAAPEKASPKTKFVAGLCGGVICDRRYITSSGRGAAVAYATAIAVKRMIYVSYEFMEKHPVVCSDLHFVLSTDGCQWTLKADLRELVEHVAKGAQYQREALAFICEAERESEDTPERSISE